MSAKWERFKRFLWSLIWIIYYIKLQKSRNRIFDETLDAYYNKQSNQLFTAIELLMLNNWVKDFYNWTEVTRWTANNSKMELHHIFPENSSIWKEIRKRWDNMLNNITNLTPLTKDTNNKFINNKSPSLYIKNFREQIWSEKFSEYLKTHFISEEMIDILERDDFDWFIKERTKLIIEKIQELADCK